MHKHSRLKGLANRIRRALAGFCLGLLVISLGLSPAAQMHVVDAAPETFDCGNVTEIPQAECEALVAFYESTGGPNWNSLIYNGWLETNTICGMWYGVSCAQGTVTSIYIEPLCLGKACEEEISMNLSGSIPSEIGNLSNLQLLYLPYNNLTSLPPEIGDLLNLSGVYLDRNPISNLPPEIGNLQNLVELDLSQNQLTSLPSEIGNLSNLADLYLSNNQLTSLPPQIGNLSSLKELYLDNNFLTSLPSEIGNLSSLQHLYLSENQLTSLPPEIGDLSNLEFLNLSQNQLTSLPPELGNLANLETLYLGDNQLSSLPPEIGNLSSLKFLILDFNQLTNLPSGLGNLYNLVYIFLYGNLLTSLPSEIGNLPNLADLNLGSNLLTNLPQEIGNLNSLNYLYLGENQLTSLTPEIGNLSNLVELSLDSNLLTSLPPEFGNLTGLEWLFLGGNQLTSLPPEIGNLTNLYDLDLSYNRLSIVDQGLLGFLNQKDPDWADTQTISPIDLQLRSAMPDSLEFTWSPIRYTVDAGYYEISYVTNLSGPFMVHGFTSDKSSNDYLAGNLPFSTNYYVRIRTRSYPPSYQSLWSEYSPPIAILSTPIDPVFGASLNYTNEQDLTTQVEVPPGTVSSAGTLYFSTQTGFNFPLNFGLTGQAFNLGIYQEGVYEDDLTLLFPMTLRVEYNESGLSAENLKLVFWDPARLMWIDAAQTCSPSGILVHYLAENRILATACRLGKYALVEQWKSFLPVVNQDKGYSP
jgi:Leucine-rich repeat (LRR) protein